MHSAGHTRVLTLLICTGIAMLAPQSRRSLAAQETHRSPQPAALENRIYWGGGVSIAFWSYNAIRVEPLVGYRITEKFSAGIKLMYEYLRYERFGRTEDSHSYGGSLFARYRLIEQLYAHIEYGGQSYERIVNASGDQERIGYPFLLLGGGFVQRTGRRTSLFFELLYDVLQDEASPYESGGPFLSIGIAVGF